MRTVLDGFAYLECPRWRDDRIWFVDFYTYRVFSAREDGSDLRVEAEVPQQPSGLGWLPDGRLLVVSMRDRSILRREADGTLVTHADLTSFTEHPLNDMLVDESGRAWVGNFGFDIMRGADIEPTVLIRVDPDGTAAVVADDLWFPNGMALTGGGVLVVGETVGNRMTAFDVAPDGSLTGRREWARFGPLPSSRVFAQALPQAVLTPDGCCLDTEGAIWVADAVGGRVARVREGGEILEEISPGESGPANVFACMLGGSDGRTLYLCAAPDFSEDLRRDAREGALLAVRVDVPRAGLP
ncbi:5-valerolactone hydrolase [Rhodococcus rhodnii LMG 5362]|uniref:5-valerolactone hydrolase n=1 Tax=Rhodococcus rhodnii LMG 5362 TaxID=1273125 RepID=R7WJT2_9NOCA|nr:5-valerolactone hydrolase [Rhodococcus rhodnii LMG 5362]